MDIMKKRLANLLTVKSIVTLILTGVFAYLAITHQIEQNFMTVYAVVIAFYFGTQAVTKSLTADPETTEPQAATINNYYKIDPEAAKELEVTGDADGTPGA